MLDDGRQGLARVCPSLLSVVPLWFQLLPCAGLWASITQRFFFCFLLLTSQLPHHSYLGSHLFHHLQNQFPRLNIFCFQYSEAFCFLLGFCSWLIHSLSLSFLICKTKVIKNTHLWRILWEYQSVKTTHSVYSNCWIHINHYLSSRSFWWSLG